MSEIFRPTLLLSMPQMQDPNFTRTVVLLCDYLPDGAFGIVLNRPTDMPASSMVSLAPPIEDGNELPLCIGGPVQPERGWILLGEPPVGTDFRTIVDGLYLSTSPAVLRRVLQSRPAPQGARTGRIRRLGSRVSSMTSSHSRRGSWRTSR